MRSASGFLRTIASAQADFRANDRDGNGRNDYWRSDIAGLYALENGGVSLQLIELSIALADDRPLTNLSAIAVPSPKAGFRLRALPHVDEIDRGPDRFAACAFPATLAEGRYGTYVISEGNLVRKRMLGHARGIEAHPSEAQMDAEAWEKFD